MKKRTTFRLLVAVVLLALAIWGIYRAVTRTNVGTVYLYRCATRIESGDLKP